MKNKENAGFEYLGLHFQQRLIRQFLVDRKFAERIIEMVNPNYFEDESLRVIAATIKNAYEKYEVIPDIDSLKMRVVGDVENEVKKKFLTGQIDRVANAEENDCKYVQDTAMQFCKQQELNKALRLCEKIIDKGDINDYEKCADIMRKALEAGDMTDGDRDVLEGLADVLSEDYRKPIPTGIDGLDDIMDGGLSRGELALILAPFGVGKTTFITKLANSGKKHDANVLQIFFEDNEKVIQRKHLSCWTGIPLNDLVLPEHRPRLDDEIEYQRVNGGRIIMKKFPSAGTTMTKIRQYVKRKISQGFRPDILLLDYIDCVQPSYAVSDANVGEGNVMREFETLLSDFDIAGWTATQGNRSSIGAEVVEADQMAGSIKKGMIGHFIVSVAKTLNQKEAGLATIAILKSRFGQDGIIYHDIKFDNSTIQIDITENNSGESFMKSNANQVIKTQERMSSIMEMAKQRRKEDEERKEREAAEKKVVEEVADSEDDNTLTGE